MSTKELVYSLIDGLDDEQLEAIAVFLKKFSLGTVVPDEDELRMIAEAEADDSDPEPIEDFAKRLGIDYGSL